jgi:hypothetical protein
MYSALAAGCRFRPSNSGDTVPPCAAKFFEISTTPAGVPCGKTFFRNDIPHGFLPSISEARYLNSESGAKTFNALFFVAYEVYGFGVVNGGVVMHKFTFYPGHNAELLDNGTVFPPRNANVVTGSVYRQRHRLKLFYPADGNFYFIPDSEERILYQHHRTSI